MAIQRRSRQDSHNTRLHGSSTIYAFRADAGMRRPVGRTEAVVSARAARPDRREHSGGDSAQKVTTSLFHYDPNLILAQLKKTAVVTVVLVVLLIIVTWWVKTHN